MRTEPEANGFRAEFAVLRPRGVYIYVGGRKRRKNKKPLKNEENRKQRTLKDSFGNSIEYVSQS